MYLYHSWKYFHGILEIVHGRLREFCFNKVMGTLGHVFEHLESSGRMSRPIVQKLRVGNNREKHRTWNTNLKVFSH